MSLMLMGVMAPRSTEGAADEPGVVAADDERLVEAGVGRGGFAERVERRVEGVLMGVRGGRGRGRCGAGGGGVGSKGRRREDESKSRDARKGRFGRG